MLRIGLLLCGCGALDGSDPLQTIALRIAAARAGDLLFPLAPDRDQLDVIGLHGPVPDQTRNCLVESTRLTGGRIDALESARADEFDVLAVPGGLGVLKTLDPAQGPVAHELLHGVLAQRGALLLLDEGIVWAARAQRPDGMHRTWRLASGNDRLLGEEITRSGHHPVSGDSEWIEDPHDPVLSIVLGGESRADLVLDVCTSGLELVRNRLRALDGTA